MAVKKAIITGITGQDGSYLSKLLLEKGYEVHGIVRENSTPGDKRLRQLLGSKYKSNPALILHTGDLLDVSTINHLIEQVQPDEIYNLAAQSNVAVSFQLPELTLKVNALGPLRLLEGIRLCGLERKTRFYQAGTSELFGMVASEPQNEKTPFNPQSPYAVSKHFAHSITSIYRSAYGIYACNGILFNHESPLRGENFVTRKITIGLTRMALRIQNELELGNLNAYRDWGHASDYVQMQWLMLQQAVPEDFVIATGEKHSVRQFVEMTASHLGLFIEWVGEGLSEVGVVHSGDFRGEVIGRIRVNPKLFRPAEVNTLLGDAGKARELLGWKPTYNLRAIVAEMVDNDLALASAESSEV